MPEPVIPTTDLVRDIVAYIRSGGFPEVAAQAAGLSGGRFAEWMERGASPYSTAAFQEFRAAVLRAQAQARLLVETEVRQKRPLDWLRCGPGRASEASDGWTGPVRSRPRAERTERDEVPAATLVLVSQIVAAMQGHLSDQADLREELALLVENLAVPRTETLP